MVNDNKITFFKRIFLSIADFESYQRFAGEKTKTAVKYILLVMFIFSAVIGITILYRFNVIFTSARQYLAADFPDFELRDGKLILNSEEPTVVENEKSTPQILIIDIKPENYTEKLEKLSLYNTGIGLFEDKIVLKLNQVKVEYLYSELQQMFNMGDFNKQELIQILNETEYISINIVLYFTLVIVLFITYTGWTLLDGIIMAALGYAMSRIYKIKIQFTSAVNIALHALTLPTILSLICIILNILTGFTVKYFDIIYTAITCVYVITAILIIRSNMIKKQIEIQDILGKQTNPEDEIFKEENPDEKKEREQKKDKETDNKKEEKNKESGEAKEGGLA